MKAEEFDQYVRAQFENETVAPPANLEGAVFATLAAENRKRRVVAATAAIGLVVTASATALWLNAPEPAQPEATQSVPSEIVVSVPAEPAAAVEHLAAPAESSAPVDPVLSQEPKGSAADARPVSAQPITSAPAAMDEVTARTLTGVEQDADAQPQLQQLEGEKWVLPATVTVKD
jgi:hypothetical protein